MKVIVLAAGQGYQLDGFNKLLITDPIDNRTIIEKYRSAFAGMDITIVVGYRAINVMNAYPDYKFVYNADWAVYNNSYSLYLAITDEPCYVISSDLLIEPELVQMLEKAGPNVVLTKARDNRELNALNATLDEDGSIQELYQGKLKAISDPEAVGIYKITSPELLTIWKRNCRDYSNLFIGQNLPLSTTISVSAVDVGNHRFDEVNTPMDYIRLINNAHSQSKIGA